jgi:nitroreductase
MNHISQTTETGDIIRKRRTVKPEKMNGRKIPDDLVLQLLDSADWAPTHGRTEPWRFIVFSNDKTVEFTRRHAELYRIHTDPSVFVEQKYKSLALQGENASHVIVAWMKRIPNHKIPEIEEICATAAAIENILLTATSLNIASFWSTGGVTHHRALREEFNLGEEDIILGLLYLGYTDEPFREGIRMIPLSEKIEWRK